MVCMFSWAHYPRLHLIMQMPVMLQRQNGWWWDLWLSGSAWFFAIRLNELERISDWPDRAQVRLDHKKVELFMDFWFSGLWIIKILEGYDWGQIQRCHGECRSHLQNFSPGLALKTQACMGRQDRVCTASALLNVIAVIKQQLPHRSQIIFNSLRLFWHRSQTLFNRPRPLIKH